MSRGPGWVERAVLDVLEEGKKLDAEAIAARVFSLQGRMTLAQLASVRRALRSLRDRGEAFRLGRFYRDPNNKTKLREMYASRAVASAYVMRLRATFGDDSLEGHPDLISLALELR